VTAVGCNLTDTAALNLSFAQIPACAKIADLLDQTTASAPEQDGGAGTNARDGG
jgi:hypothetical protein